MSTATSTTKNYQALASYITPRNFPGSNGSRTTT
jgi:hypothetical protein